MKTQEPTTKAEQVIAGVEKPKSPYEMARLFVGTNERRDAKVMSSFFKEALGEKLDPSKTPWCAAFVNAMLKTSGDVGTQSNMARSFLNYGKKTDRPSEGDIVVLRRGGSRVLGHVGFYAGEDENGNVQVLGGNQGDRVSIKSFPKSKVLGYRQPPTSLQMKLAMREVNK